MGIMGVVDVADVVPPGPEVNDGKIGEPPAPDRRVLKQPAYVRADDVDGMP
jgi:hypothetical protein